MHKCVIQPCIDSALMMNNPPVAGPQGIFVAPVYFSCIFVNVLWKDSCQWTHGSCRMDIKTSGDPGKYMTVSHNPPMVAEPWMTTTPVKQKKLINVSHSLLLRNCPLLKTFLQYPLTNVKNWWQKEGTGHMHGQLPIGFRIYEDCFLHCKKYLNWNCGCHQQMGHLWLGLVMPFLFYLFNVLINEVVFSFCFF